MSVRPEQRRPQHRRRLVLAVAAIAALPAIAAPVVFNAITAANGEVAPITHVPPDRPELGMRYAGLTPAKKGEPCVGGYRVTDRSTCSHGPDAPPPGLDINRDVPPVAPAAEEPAAPRADNAPAPTDGDLARDAGATDAVDDAPALLADAAPETAGFTMAPSGVACDGDGTSGKRVQVLYVRGSATASRFGAYLASFRTWSAAVNTIYDASAQETGGSRHIRFVTTADCNVDVREVEVPDAAISDFSATIRALSGLGYNRTDRKYMIFADSKVYCGIGSFPGDRSTAAAVNRSNKGPHYGRTDSGCWSPSVAAHELGHNLGAVNSNSPNSDKKGHCLDEYDVMCYQVKGGPAMVMKCTARSHDQRLDCNHDDYYHTNPSPGSYLATNWNVANSEFLLRGPDAGGGGGGGGGTPPATRTPTASPSSGRPATPPATTRAPTPARTTPARTTPARPTPARTTPVAPTTQAGTPSGSPGATASPTASPTGSPSGGIDPTQSPTPVPPDTGELRPLRISDTSTNSVRLSWEPAATGTRYAVLLDGRALGTVRSTSVRVRGLRPDTEYRFGISVVRGDRGLTPYTEPATVRTGRIPTVTGGSRAVVLSNAMTGGVAEVFGARSADGTAVVLSRRNGAASQQWKLEATAGGYLLRSQATGKCVAPLAGSRPTAGTPLAQYPCDAGSATQVWRTTTTPFGSALTTGDGLVVGVNTQRCGGDRVLALQRPSTARYQSWTVEAV